MKKILISLFIVTVAATLTAQTRPFEDSKTSYDPFVAEKGGFESLFVNPASMAGDTNIFTWDIEAGAKLKKSTYDTIMFMMDNSAALTPSENPDEEMTEEEAEELVVLLSDNLDQDSVDLLTDGTDLDGMTPDEIEAFFNEGGTLDETQIDQVATNVETNQDAILDDALGDLDVTVEFTTKIGTLIKGFGIGFYGNVFSILNAGQMGFEKMIVETGVKAGYGFNLGKFGLGVSGDLAFVGDLTHDGGFSVVDPTEIMNQVMYYGYAWGFDVGATYSILPTLTVGAVMTDLIGSYAPIASQTVEDFLAGAEPGKIDYKYSFDLDIDFGITWAPQIGNGKLLNASFSADYYNLIGLFRPETQPENFQGFLDHMRFGAHLELLSFINLRAQYYQEYFSLGAGVDLLFLEVFGEFQFKQTFDDLGGAVLVKLHF